MNGISVVIPTLNRTEFLKNTLIDLFIQDFELPYEILIIDQSSQLDKDILKYIEEKSNVKYYHITQFKGLPEARNFGWQHASYDYILYVDDDIQCSSNLLAEHYRYIADPLIGVVAGGITEANKKNQEDEVGRFIRKTASPLRGFHKKGVFEVDHAGGGNFSVKKDILWKISGVDENLTKGAALYEETDFCLRVKKIGYKILFNSEAHIVHLAAATGGCRVEDIDKYIYALVRNRSLIIGRHLKGVNRITAQLYLFKLVAAYVYSYKKINLFNIFFKARVEGLKACKCVKCSIWNEK